MSEVTGKDEKKIAAFIAGGVYAANKMKRGFTLARGGW